MKKIIPSTQKSFIRVALSCTVASALLLPAVAWTAPNTTDLPVKDITLFQSGVGYFEHSGAVQANSEISISFQADQINDVLKSLVVTDPQQAIREVRYPSQDPLERSLSGFAIDLSQADSLADILQQLRGAEVVVTAPEAIRGRVLAVNYEQQVKDDTIFETIWLTLATKDGMQRLPLDSIRTIKPTDEKLNNELQQALLLLADNQNQDGKTVTLNFGGQSQRDVTLGYLVETPVWKTTWRLNLGSVSSGNQANATQSSLQGWALVENTSDTDWNDVRLSLVSGQPVSFSMDLYTPLYAQRPQVAVPKPPQVQPKAYAGATVSMESDEAEGMFAKRQRMARNAAFDDAEFESRAMAMPMAAPVVAQAAPAPPPVQTATVGEFFQYQLKQTVTLPRRTSAMLPIVNGNIDAEKISIYNAEEQQRHPMHGVLLQNTSGAALMAGPVTIYQDGYAGDAQIGHIPQDAQRLLAYAVNVDVLSESENLNERQVVSAKIVDGVMVLEQYQDLSTIYRFKNEAADVGGSPENLIIEHRKRHDYELLQPAAVFETTYTHYRFKQAIPAGETTEFTVTQRQVQAQNISLLNWNVDTLLSYSKNGQISADVRETLAEAAKRKQAVANLDRQIQAAQREINEITNSQSRLRDNIATVGANSSLGKRYMQKLSTQEDRLETLQQTISKVTRQRQQAQQRLRDYLNDLGTIE